MRANPQLVSAPLHITYFIGTSPKGLFTNNDYNYYINYNN